MPLKTKTSLVIDELSRALLSAGTAGIVVVAPNAVQALEQPLKKILGKRKSLDSRKIAYYAKRQELVKVVENSDGSFCVSLSEKGLKRGVAASFETMSIPRQRSWDKRWRIVLYDIPEQHVASRRFLLEKLKTLNFYMLQRSMWVYPYPCLEQIELIKHVLPEIAPHVVLLETDKIDKHNQLVKHFAPILPL